MGGDVRMNLIERFTRDRASRFVWGLVALACALAFLFARQGEDRASGRSLDAATSRSLASANQVIAPLVEEKSDGLHLYYKTVYPSVQAGIFTDPTVAVVRVWSADGNLLFASDSVGRLAGQVQVSGPWIQTVTEGRTYSQIVMEQYTPSTTGTAPTDTAMFQTFTPLLVPDRIAPVGAVEIDYLYDTLRSEGASAWARLQLLLGALFLASLAMFVLSMRTPAEAATAGSWRSRIDRLRGGSTREPARPAEVEAPRPAAAPATAADTSATSASAGAERADDAQRARIAELEEALAAAEWELSGLKAKDEAQAATVAALEARLAERGSAEEPNEVEPTTEEPEAKAAEAEEQPEPEAEEQPEPEPEEESEPEEQPEPEAIVNGERADPLSQLEARLASAEQRASEAVERVSQASPEAADLRERLARTAARKKGIASTDDRAPSDGEPPSG